MSVRALLDFFGFRKPVPDTSPLQWACWYKLTLNDEQWGLVAHRDENGDPCYIQIKEIRVVGSDLESCAVEYLRSIGIRKVVAA